MALDPKQWWKQKCPNCPNAVAECETVDNGVGLIACSPFHCYTCGWTEGDDITSKPTEPEEFPDNALDSF